MENLVLIQNREFHGIVGTKTKVMVNETPVCIGDVVKVAEGSNNNECQGLVAVFGNKISVMGLASEPISTMKIVEIVHSHNELELGSYVKSNFKVDRFQE